MDWTGCNSLGKPLSRWRMTSCTSVRVVAYLADRYETGIASAPLAGRNGLLAFRLPVQKRGVTEIEALEPDQIA